MLSSTLNLPLLFYCSSLTTTTTITTTTASLLLSIYSFGSQAEYEAYAAGNNRKRAFSTPHIMHNINNVPLSSHANSIAPIQKYASGATVFEMDDTFIPEGWIPGKSDSNIYTNLALGNQSYLLETPLSRETSVAPASLGHNNRASDFEEEEEEQLYYETADQFSPTLYSLTTAPKHKHHPIHQTNLRSLPIPINSANNSPQKRVRSVSAAGLGEHIMPASRLISAGSMPHVMGNNQYDAASNINDSRSPSPKLSFSYDPAFGAAVNRLAVPASGSTSARSSPIKGIHEITNATGIIGTAPTSPQNRSAELILKN